MSPKPVSLIEAATMTPVAASLKPTLIAAEIVAAESQWAPHRRAAPDEAEHSHWDWSLKIGLLNQPGVRCVGIEYAGEMQGMMAVKETGHPARLDPDRGQPVVYVEFLESAPWNSRAVVRVPRYLTVGRRLLAAAVELSMELGHDGRVGLHSLPQSEGFYEYACGMYPWGQDPGYHGLMYYEFTVNQATEYLRWGT
ncbi:MAG TPA: hypothetical protein VFG68_04100 [Fimbriiglobus sp.]|nr:hypothetical protein [Fimbriiglobus sp.]